MVRVPKMLVRFTSWVNTITIIFMWWPVSQAQKQTSEVYIWRFCVGSNACNYSFLGPGICQEWPIVDLYFVVWNSPNNSLILFLCFKLFRLLLITRQTPQDQHFAIISFENEKVINFVRVVSYTIRRFWNAVVFVYLKNCCRKFQGLILVVLDC